MKRRATPAAALRRLGDRILEAPDLGALTTLLARELPPILGRDVALLLWDRKLETFEALAPGETRGRPVSPGNAGLPDMDTRYLLSQGELIETPAGTGDGVLVPLLARSGLAGMLALAPRRRGGRAPLSAPVRRAVSGLAGRAALAIENQMYQRELIASERMAALGTMAGMLAHDFRGPMTVIRGYAETLLDGDATPQEVRERAELIVQMVDRLERMTGETLDFARGSGRLVRRRIEVGPFLRELAAAVELELPGLAVVREFPADGGAAVCADVDKLRRAVLNIAANARDAMGGSGRLLLSARVSRRGPEARLVLDLADEGPGVPAEIRDSLFEPFVTRGKKGGTGLGLAVARRFVEDHGGTLELLPDGPGARFCLAVPLGEPGEDPSRPATATSGRGVSA